MTRQSTFIRPKGRIPSSSATRTRMTCSATPTKTPGAGLVSYKDTHDMFSYSNKNTRSWAFVVRGLPDDMDEQELVDELAAQKIELVKLYKMKKTKTPLFLVVPGSRTTPAQLNKMYPFLDHAKIKWDWYRAAKTSIQCRKCQRWGHSASNCFAKDPKCVKCAESHATHNCRKEDSTPAKCANCGGDHPASFRDCPTHIAYQSGKDKAAAAARKQQPRRDPARSYQPAPIPAINPWRQPPSDPPQTATSQVLPACPNPCYQPVEATPIGPTTNRERTSLPQSLLSTRGGNPHRTHHKPRTEPRQERTSYPLLVMHYYREENY
ncbi:hypothetical protein QE152_g13509 [Popillia japonica]|uniref:Nucleic-acid-binding protein from transposon X-element n=1 Tax=Popillia japonica TaxID=7064 RepID=A0AAW1LB22_POPJA